MKAKVHINTHETKELSEMLKALGHPARVKIMWLLCHTDKGRMTVKSIYEMLRMSQPVISRHLGILRANNLIKRSVEGKQTFYEPHILNKNVSRIVTCFKSIN